LVRSLSILVSLLIVRSISKPLANLTEGTRAIADGKFFYRLDTTRKDEFAQLAQDFNKMTLRLNELDELKKDFVSHVSHELKAPLASMQETIQIMLEEIPGPLTEKQKRLLALNLQSGTRLTSMISNLLDHSTAEAGVMVYALSLDVVLPVPRDYGTRGASPRSRYD
jgi:two-component system sensor histidine kinase GlrK